MLLFTWHFMQNVRHGHNNERATQKGIYANE